MLATTVAGPIPGQAALWEPIRIRPDQLISHALEAVVRCPAFDSQSGRMVLLVENETWTFDVCTNTWELMNPIGTPSQSGLRLNVLVPCALRVGAFYDPEDEPWWIS